MEPENKYARGKIYRIVDNTSDQIYIGSTCEKTLARRLAQHRNEFRAYSKHGKRSFLSSFNILKNNDYAIFLMEEYPCKSKDELLARERYYIENNNCVNKVKPVRTEKEKTEYQAKYRADNKAKAHEYFKEYCAQNKDKRAAKDKLYYEQNKKKLNTKYTCECGGRYTHQARATHFKTKKHQKYCKEINQEKNTQNE